MSSGDFTPDNSDLRTSDFFWSSINVSNSFTQVEFSVFWRSNTFNLNQWHVWVSNALRTLVRNVFTFNVYYKKMLVFDFENQLVQTQIMVIRRKLEILVNSHYSRYTQVDWFFHNILNRFLWILCCWLTWLNTTEINQRIQISQIFIPLNYYWYSKCSS